MNLLQGILPPNDDINSDDANLEAEFRQILYIIKPHIENITNHNYIKMYGLWLKKLSDIQDNKRERNKYLLELANQIHDGSLKPPFTSPPPEGSLPPIRTYSAESDEFQWTTVEPASDYLSPEEYKESLKRRFRKEPMKHSRSPSPKSASEKNSWQDLSDSVSYVGDLQNVDELEMEVEEEKNKNLEPKYSALHEMEGLRMQQHYSQKYGHQVGKKTSEISTLTERNREMDLLRTRMIDLVEVKNALKDSHNLSEDRKKTIGILEKKLEEMKKANDDLKEIIGTMTKKNIELEIAKTKAENEIRDKFSRIRNKELEMMKHKHEEELKNALACKSGMDDIKTELENKIASMEEKHKEEIKSLEASYETKIKESQDEIEKLKKELTESKTREGEIENKTEEINDLKTCISKMDKLLQKSEKDYLKKIDKLKQELDMKDLMTNMKLQTQRAEMLLKASSHKQDEMQVAVGCLEEKYRKILESQKAQAQEMNDKNERTIGELKNLLLKYDIPFNLKDQ